MERRGAAHHGRSHGGPAAARSGRRLRRDRPAARTSLPHSQPTGTNRYNIYKQPKSFLTDLQIGHGSQ